MALLSSRRLIRAPEIERVRMIAKQYNMDIVAPLPEISKDELPAIANLLAVGVDGHGQRVASVLPEVTFPPKDVTQALSVKRAADRRRAVLGWLEQCDYDQLLYKRARYLVAYGSSPIIIRPDDETGLPTFDVRNPIDSYLAPQKTPTDMLPDDGIFVYPRTLDWLIQHYPAKAAVLERTVADKAVLNKRDYRIEVIEYRDKEQTTLLAGGAGALAWSLQQDQFAISAWNSPTGPGWATLLETAPNLTGRTGIVNPTRITLDRPKGQFDDMVGLFQMAARLAGLDYHANVQAVFPDVYWVMPEGGSGDYVKANGRIGQVGVVEGGSLQVINPQPGQSVGNAQDRLERAQRISGAVIAEMSGESPTNIRTDTRGQSVAAASLDFHIAEHQMLLAKSLKRELEMAVQVSRKYFGDEPRQFYVNWPNAQGYSDYVPNVIFKDSQALVVEYAQAGYDAQTLATDTGQRVALGLMSRETGMRRDPAIKDAEKETGRVNYEAIIDALKQRTQTEVGTPGQLPTTAVVSLARYLKSQMPFEDAYEKVHEEVQAQQAAQQAAAQNGAPGAGATDPYAQPGLDAGTPLDTGTPSIGAVPQAANNLRQGLRAINGGVAA